jgi:serine/threonine protein kinase
MFNNKLFIIYKIMESFEKYKNVKKILGKGTFGKVYTTDIPNTAVKLSKYEDYDDYGISESTIREFSILRLLNDLGGHPNIIHLKNAFILNEGDTALILPLAKSTLSVKGLTDDIDARKVVMYQLMRGVAYMHSKHIMHLDLKPPNILVFEDGSVKISDFGLSNFIINYDDPANKTMDVMTLWWRAPELLAGYVQYTNLADVWSMGVILASLIKGEHILTSENDRGMMHQIFTLIDFADENWVGTNSDKYKNLKQSFIDTKSKNKNIITKESVPNIFKRKFKITDDQELDLLVKMLAWPYERISALNSLNHPYFDSVRDKVDQLYKAPKIEESNCEHILEQMDIPIGGNIELPYVMFIDCINGIISICKSLKLRYRVVFSSISMFIKYITIKNIHNKNTTKDKMMLIMLGCVIINSKLYNYETSFELSFLRFRFMREEMDNIEFHDGFINTENEIIETLNFKLIIPNVTDYYMIDNKLRDIVHDNYMNITKMCLYLMSIPEIVLKYNSKQILSTVFNYLKIDYHCFKYVIKEAFDYLDNQNKKLYKDKGPFMLLDNNN